MTSHYSGSNIITRRYASALIESSYEKNAVEAVEKDIVALEKIVAYEEFFRFIKNPAISVQEQTNVLNAIFSKLTVHELTKNFLLTLVQNRRFYLLDSVLASFHAVLAQYRGEIQADVKTAMPLTKTQKDQLQKELSQSIGRPVNITDTVREDLIGGVVVTIGSRMIDDSIKGKIERLAERMYANENENLEIAS